MSEPTTDEQAPDQPDQRPARRIRPVHAALAAGAVVVVAGAVAVGVVIGRSGGSDDRDGAAPSDAEPVTVRGHLDLVDGYGWRQIGTPCSGDGGYDDIRAGAQVVVTDPAGETIGLSRLEAGEIDYSSLVGARVCRFHFRIEDVPGGESTYGVEVSHRGVVQFTAEEVERPVPLSLG